jgi:hypothetical protein
MHLMFCSRDLGQVIPTTLPRAFASLIAADDTSDLQKELGLCTPVAPGNATQASSLVNLLLQTFSMGAEFNYPYASPGRTPVATPFFTLLDIARNTSDPIQLLSEVNWLWYKPMGAECLDHEHATDFVKNVAVPLINYNVFSYITCQ